LERLTQDGRVLRATDIGHDRYALELPVSVEPHALLTELAPFGARLVSVQPLRDSLEDFFVRQVGAAPGDRGLGAA
jgi:hypothetical protein